jgi:eukaryotic translation initiation factor 2C
MNKIDREINILVDLDVEAGRGSRSAGKNVFRLVVRPTRTINLASINAWLGKRIDMNESVLEAFSEFPSPLTLDPLTWLVPD